MQGLEGLRIRIGADEINPLNLTIDHVVDRVAAATTHPDHLDHGVLIV